MTVKYKHRKWFLTFPTARLSRHWMKKIKIRGTENLSLYRFFKIFFYNIGENEIIERANGVAFNFILAIFPTIIFLFTLIPYISTYVPSISSEAIMVYLGEYLPASMYESISSTVLDIVSKQRGGLLTFGFIFAFYLATNGMMALMRAFNACYKTVENRGFLQMRLVATGLTMLISVVLIAAVVLLVAGTFVINKVTHELSDLSHLQLDKMTIIGLLLLRFLVIFIVFFFAVSFIYYFGPAVHYNWKFFSVGSLIATLACLAVSYGFSFYITNFGSYNKVYGSIGALIGLMVWIQLLTIVLLFGYEINAALHYGQKVVAIEHHHRRRRRENLSRK